VFGLARSFDLLKLISEFSKSFLQYFNHGSHLL
jgi:hypothetical protein